MNRLIWVLSAALLAVGIITRATGTLGPVLFFVSCAGIIPLAALIGQATEAIAAQCGPRLGGLLSATFGNAVEMIIGLLALHNGLITLVKASITGSILGNLLLVLGASFLVGGIRHPVQRFNTRAARSQAAMLMLAVGVALVVPAIFVRSQPTAGIPLSVATSVVLFLVYVAGLLFTLITHADLFRSIVTEEREPARWTMRTALLILAVATLAVAMESDWLVAGVKSVGHRLGWSEMFIGVIVVAVVGNAAEHASAVWMAWKDRMELSLEIAVGSSLQVAMFVTPILFGASLLFGHAMPLLFTWPELASMASAVLLVVVLTMDGESNWLEGALAVGAYAVMAVGFFTLRA